MTNRPAERPVVFLSYRRDDAAGYAGRLEEALEARLGRGSVFRDLQDIAPGEDFVDAIRRRLADAQAVLVLIGPRWAGERPDGPRRIDDEHDFVRLEVRAALESGARVLPVLLPGATMPAEAELPESLRALARRNALQLSDPHWAADVERLAQACGVAAARRAVWPWVAGGAVAAAAVVAALCAWRATPAPPAGERAGVGVGVGVGEQQAAAAAAQARLVGRWQAALRYPWGAQVTESFEFRRHAGALVGTASFLGVPRVIEGLEFDGTNLRFRTRSDETMSNETRTKTHAYAAELRGTPPDELLAFRLETTGGFGIAQPLDFEARRVPAAAPPAASAAGSTPTGR